MSYELTPEKARIWRIVHINNLGSIFKHGFLSRNSSALIGKYTEIGNQALIQKRTSREVPIAPGGTLSDYVPFYFTPFSPMLYNIKTGVGVVKQEMDDIVIFATSLHKLKEMKVPFVFTDRHAYLLTAQFFREVKDVEKIDWLPLQQRNFKKDNPDRFEKYQAEALVYQQVPFEALTGVVCYSDNTRTKVEQAANEEGLKLNIFTRPKWFL
jgi:ssDNA thymidine ADP-ribosyltransferase, DarT